MDGGHSLAGAGEQGGGRLASESCLLAYSRSRENGERSKAAMTKHNQRLTSPDCAIQPALVSLWL